MVLSVDRFPEMYIYFTFFEEHDTSAVVGSEYIYMGSALVIQAEWTMQLWIFIPPCFREIGYSHIEKFKIIQLYTPIFWILYNFPCRNDLNIAFVVHQTVFPNVSGSMVRYNVDNNPNGNIDGIQPTINSILVRVYPAL